MWPLHLLIGCFLSDILFLLDFCLYPCFDCIFSSFFVAESAYQSSNSSLDCTPVARDSHFSINQNVLSVISFCKRTSRFLHFVTRFLSHNIELSHRHFNLSKSTGHSKYNKQEVKRRMDTKRVKFQKSLLSQRRLSREPNLQNAVDYVCHVCPQVSQWPDDSQPKLKFKKDDLN